VAFRPLLNRVRALASRRSGCKRSQVQFCLGRATRRAARRPAQFLIKSSLMPIVRAFDTYRRNGRLTLLGLFRKKEQFAQLIVAHRNPRWSAMRTGRSDRAPPMGLSTYFLSLCTRSKSASSQIYLTCKSRPPVQSLPLNRPRRLQGHSTGRLTPFKSLTARFSTNA
jgi:hypothetical protein